MCGSLFAAWGLHFSLEIELVELELIYVQIECMFSSVPSFPKVNLQGETRLV